MEEKKLTISPCTLQTDGSLSVDTSRKFETLLNPASYNKEKSTSYNEDVTLGQLGSDLRFNAINPEKLDLNIMLDGTGVLHPASSDTEPQDVCHWGSFVVIDVDVAYQGLSVAIGLFCMCPQSCRRPVAIKPNTTNLTGKKQVVAD